MENNDIEKNKQQEENNPLSMSKHSKSQSKNSKENENTELNKKNNIDVNNNNNNNNSNNTNHEKEKDLSNQNKSLKENSIQNQLEIKNKNQSQNSLLLKDKSKKSGVIAAELELLESNNNINNLSNMKKATNELNKSTGLKEKKLSDLDKSNRSHSRSPLRSYIEGHIDNSLVKFTYENIYSSKTLNQNSIYKLSEATLMQDKEDFKDEKHVYILQLKFIDYLTLSENPENKNKENFIEQVHSNFYSKVCSNNKTLEKLGLKKIGYIISEIENKLSFIYLKEHFINFSFDRFINNYNGHQNFYLMKYQLIFDILITVKTLHNIGRKIGFFHPSLIFYDIHNNAFQYLDISLDEYISLIDKNQHSQILNNFGYFDTFCIDEIEEDKHGGFDLEENSVNKTYLKTDILLLICFINFLFATKKVSKKREDIISSQVFEKHINELQKDYLSSSHKLSHFLNTSNENSYIKILIEDHVNLDIKHVCNIDGLIIEIGKLIKKETDGELCSECSDVKFDNVKGGYTVGPTPTNKMSNANFLTKNLAKKSINNESTNQDYSIEDSKNKSYNNNADKIFTSFIRPFDNKSLSQLFVTDFIETFNKKIKLDCLQIICKYCFYTHKCPKTQVSKFSNLDSGTISKEVKQKAEGAFSRMQNVNEINTVKMTDYYEKEIEPLIVGIKDQNSYFMRILKMEEESILSLTQYLEFCLKQQIDSQNEVLEKNITSCKDQIHGILSEIESYKFNNVADNKFQPKVFEEKSRVFHNNQSHQLNFNNITDLDYTELEGNMDKNNIREKLNETLRQKIDTLLQEKDVCQLFGKKIDYSLSKTKELVSFINQMKNQLNNHRDMKILIQEVDKASQDYLNDFKNIIHTDLQQNVESVSVFSEFVLQKAEDIQKMKGLEKLRYQTNYTIIPGHIAFLSKKNELIVLFPQKDDKVKLIKGDDSSQDEENSKSAISMVEEGNNNNKIPTEENKEMRNKNNIRIRNEEMKNFVNLTEEGDIFIKQHENLRSATFSLERVFDNVDFSNQVKEVSNKEQTFNNIKFGENSETQPAEKEKWEIPKNSKLINNGNKLFIMGGLEYKDVNTVHLHYTDYLEDMVLCTSKRSYVLTYDYDHVFNYVINLEIFKENDMAETKEEEIIKSFSLKPIAQMEHPRDQTCLLKLNDFEIMAISGYATPTCEIYSYLKNKWTDINPLPFPLYNSSAFLHNGVYVYVFFGFIGYEGDNIFHERPKNMKKKGVNYSDSIYRYKLYKNFVQSWETIYYKYDTSKIYFNFINPVIIPTTDYENVLILGGKRVSTEHRKVLFNKNRPGMSVSESSLQRSSNIVELSEDVYCFNVVNETIHLLDTAFLTKKAYFTDSLVFRDTLSKESDVKEVVIGVDEYGNKEIVSYCNDFLFISSELDVVGLKDKKVKGEVVITTN